MKTGGTVLSSPAIVRASSTDASSSVSVGSCALSACTIWSRIARMRLVSSGPAFVLAEKMKCPSNMPTVQLRMPVPFLPQLPVRAMRRQRDRSIRSPW